MSEESDQAPRKTPPPPDIKKGPPPAPTPSALDRPPADPPRPPLKVSVSEDDGDAGEEGAPGGEASLQDRVIATVIDAVVCAGIYLAVTFVLPDFLGRLGTLLSVGYLLTRDSLPFLGGQSVGKKAMHIRAVTTGGQSLAGNWKPGLIRNAVLLIPLFPLVELFVLITRDDKPGPTVRLGDEWAGTKVIRVAADAAEEDSGAGEPSGDEGGGDD
ncbi:MAG: RDD family protein [Akkermansiaceae bacterium]|nr:RDD family protein [Akkermansiaceae bacterium]NNM31252.1 RDD family protein [Akkermansiaceae bacterium]